MRPTLYDQLQFGPESPDIAGVPSILICNTMPQDNDLEVASTLTMVEIVRVSSLKKEYSSPARQFT